MDRLKEFISSKKIKINYIDNKLNIVNFKEIALLTDKKIILLSESKTIVVNGNELTLLKLLDHEVLIGGFIKSIEL